MADLGLQRAARGMRLLAISRMRRTFSSKGSMLQSYITEVKPSEMASSTSSGVKPWSK